LKLVWVDANVLLRLLTNDPPEMAEKAAALAVRAQRGEVVLRVAPLVVAEVVWVLGSFYGFSRREIADALTGVLMAEGVDAGDRELVLATLHSMAEANVDFVDAYLAQAAVAQGQAVCSFDEDFRRLDVDIVKPG
jgi:predicted nucleic acid-binding protein